MTDASNQEFHVSASLRRKSQAEKVVEKEGCFGLSLTVSLRRELHIIFFEGCPKEYLIQKKRFAKKKKGTGTILQKLT